MFEFRSNLFQFVGTLSYFAVTRRNVVFSQLFVCRQFDRAGSAHTLLQITVCVVWIETFVGMAWMTSV